MGHSCSRKAVEDNEAILAKQVKPREVVLGDVRSSSSGNNSRSLPNFFRVAPRPTSKSLLGLSGLDNLGNTCYLNACLQCLSNCQPLSDYFMQELDKRDITNQSSRKNPILTSLLGELFRVQWTRSLDYISPKRLVEHVSSDNPKFRLGELHDAYEALVYILGQLHLELTRPNRSNSLPYICKNKAELDAATAWERFLERNESVITDIFTGQLRIIQPCKHCNFQADSYESFTHLSLPIPGKRSVTLKECFNEFVNSTDPRVPWKCSGCNRSQPTSKAIRLTKAPPVLILHFDRFANINGKVTKNTTVVDFKVYNLSLQPWFAEGSKQTSIYSLVGLILHRGTAGNGHYSAACLNRHSHTWSYFDDEHVTQIDFEDIPKGNVYILIYQMSQPKEFYQLARDRPSEWGFNLEYTEKPAKTKHLNLLRVVDLGNTYNKTALDLKESREEGKVNNLRRSGELRRDSFTPANRLKTAHRRQLSDDEPMAKLMPPSLAFDNHIAR